MTEFLDDRARSVRQRIIATAKSECRSCPQIAIHADYYVQEVTGGEISIDVAETDIIRFCAGCPGLKATLDKPVGPIELCHSPNLLDAEQA